MSRSAHGTPAFTENRHCKSLDLCTLINPYGTNNSDFIGGFAGSLRVWKTGLDPEPSGANSLHFRGCTPQLEFDAATSIVTNGRIPISENLQSSSGKGRF